MADVDSKLEVNNRNGIQLQLGKPRTTNQPSPHVKLENASSLKKVRSIRACPELRLIVDERMKEFRLRNALPKTIFTAQPSHVTFRNFKLNKWYKELKKTWPYSMYIDESACYNIDMGINIPNESLQTLIRVTNKGKASVSFRWQKREVRGKGNRLPEHNHFPLKNLDVEPSTGVFPPSSVICFTVIAVLLDLSSNRYSAVLQLYAEDIPLASVPETLKLHVEDCKSKRRNCSTSVDVWVADIEVWLQCASKYADDIRDK
ncbi:hypothetical protein KM043_017333 [Ampulex compressa]|nr:hypothetical protein KM043_017333 [Ampulex compressa]